MRSQKVILSILFFLIVAGVATLSYALTVQISSPGATTITRGPGTRTTPLPGLTQTAVDISGITLSNGFTIDTDPLPGPARAVAEQSGSIESWFVVDTLITAPPTGCSTTSPCVLTITATSDTGDFPIPKPTGTYPANVILSANFVGTIITGNKISASGGVNTTVALVDVINITPGPGDTPVSIPSSCASNPNGVFVADTVNECNSFGRISFNDTMTDNTSRLDCGAAATCPPSGSVSVTVTFVNPGESVRLPVGLVQARQPSAAALPGAIAALGTGIDIKPGSFPNSINPNSQGKIPVAILSSPYFNAPTQVIKDSLKFGRTGNELSLDFCNPNGEDVNGDGFLDLVCHFRTPLTGFQSGDKSGVLKGEMTAPGTIGTIPFTASDSVRIVP